MQCYSYKMRSCWRKAAKGAEYCSTCFLNKSSDELERLSITSLTQIQEVSTHSFFKAIQARNELLDMLLRKMYIFNKPLLLEFIKIPFIRDVFTARLYIHTESITCSSYGYLLRMTGLCGVCPVKCARCIATTLLYSGDKQVKSDIVDALVHREDIYWSINKSLKLLPYSKHIYNGLVEAGYYGEAKKYKKDDIHPLEYGTLSMCCLAPLLKERISVLKDELMERSWHPTRVYHWVWTEDKKSKSYWPTQPYMFSTGIANWML
jgi:hypothetical protein